MALVPTGFPPSTTVACLGAVLLCCAGNPGVQALDLPLAPGDASVIEEIAAIEGIELEVCEKPIWAVRPATAALEDLGIDTVEFGSISIRDAAHERRALVLVHDGQGRLHALAGNGPWLRNESLALFARLPELRVIRIDHNIPMPKSEVPHDLYDGSGFASLVDSKLASVKIGHAFDDDGMRALASIPTLVSIEIGHSKVTDEGVAALEGHPRLEAVSFAPMGRPNVTDRAFAVFATIPHLKRIGMRETFVTYEGGFAHLKPLAGRLEAVDLTWTLVLPSDVEKLMADHPGLEVKLSPMAEVAKKPFRRNQLLRWASPEAVAHLEANE